MPPYEPNYAGPFIAAFAFASAVALLALVFDLRKLPWRRACACAALVLLALALALSCAEVVSWRAEMDAKLAPELLSACDKELVRHEAYGEARATAGLALAWAPVALLVATFVAARSLKRPASLGWAFAPWALFATAGYLYSQPLPGRALWPGRCALYRQRDAILGSDHEKRRSACLDFAALLKNPHDMAGCLGGESQATVLPELPELKKRCLADLLEWERTGGEYVSRVETLGSPFVTPEDVPEVQRKLDEMGAP